jgi:hypothetical protein
MFLSELLVALVIALLLSSILFGIGWGQHYREGPWGGLVAWFIILLLMVWAGGIWMPPFGPRFKEVSWFPFVITGIFIILLLLIAVPRPWRRPRTRREAVAQAEMARQEEVVEASVFGCLFWLLIVLLIFALFSRYTIYQRPVPPPAASAFEHGNTPVAVGSEHSNSRQTRSLVKSNTVFREGTEHGSTTL